MQFHYFKCIDLLLSEFSQFHSYCVVEAQDTGRGPNYPGDDAWTERTSFPFVMQPPWLRCSVHCPSRPPMLGQLQHAFLRFRGKNSALALRTWDCFCVKNGIKLNLMMRTGPQICHGNIWPSGALGGLIVIQQQLEAARLERSHTPRGVILMWALGPWDQNNCICMVVSGCPHLSGIWGALGNSLIISAALFSLERRERLLRCLQPATYISTFSGLSCH